MRRENVLFTKGFISKALSLINLLLIKGGKDGGI